MSTPSIPDESIDALIAHQLPEWLTRAAPAQLGLLRTAMLRQQTAQDQLNGRLAAIMPLDEFATRLLKTGLAGSGIVLAEPQLAQVKTVTLQPAPPISPALPVTWTRIEATQNLVAAALHNFHEAETRPDHFASGSQLTDPLGKVLPLSVGDFASLCRRLDIGRHYQSHLQSQLTPDGMAGAVVEAIMEEALMASLELAAVLARVKDVLDEAALQQILRLTSQDPAQPSDGSSLKCHTLRLLGKRIIGALAIEVRQDARLLGIVAWLPDDPYAPVSWHINWSLLYMTLGMRLRDRAYRGYFQRFIAERDRVAFASALKPLLNHGSSVLPLPLDGRHFAVEGEVFATLAKGQIEKMLDDARVLAVSTGDEDAADRRARLQGYLDIGMNLLGLAALFVPGLGQVMLAVTVEQLASEVYEGYQDWQLGDRNAALGHLLNVAETVALGAVTAAGATALGKLAERVARVDALVPVRAADGRLRLCDADLSMYQHEGVELQQGQAVRQDGRTLRRLHDGVYQVSEGEDGVWRICHPHRQAAYRPALEHNDAGGWLHEFEAPQAWQDTAAMVRRLASRTANVSDDAATTALQITGIDADRLRRLLLENAPPPARLLDALERQQLHAERPALRGAAFEEVFNDRQVHPQAADQVLLRDFPGLTPRSAREIVDQASSVELDSLIDAGRVPLTLAERARWALRDSRIDRACAGLRQAEAANDDTASLALGLVEAIAPWPENVSVELPRGNLLQSLLEQLDSRQKVLLGHAELTEQMLGERLGRQAVTDREAAARLMGLAPVGQGIRPPLRELDGRLGYPLSGRREGSRQALRRGMQQFFPLYNGTQLDAYLQSLRLRGIDPWSHFNELHLAKASLKQALQAWRNEPGLGIVRRLRRVWVARRVLESWRRMHPGPVAGDFTLRLASNRVGGLPALPAQVNFNHITHLTLRDMQLTALEADFLGRFSGVRELDLRDNQLVRIPPGIEQLTELRSLRLGGNRIVLTTEDNQRLAQLAGLRRLDLNGNPIALLPPLASFPLLRRLSLRNTGLGALPADLGRHGNLAFLDMRDNQIQTLPEALSALPLRLLQGLELHDNPLSDETVQRLQLARAVASVPARQQAVHVPFSASAASPWLSGFTAPQRQLRLARWNRLSQEAASTDLFRLISDLQGTRDYHTQPRDLQARVWNIIEACEQHAEVRERLFEQASRPRSCSDELLLTLSELEVGAMVARVTASAAGQNAELPLLKLGRSLSRLDKVNAIAARHIAENLSDDPVEVYMAYRVKLADSLDLPAQSSHMHYESFSGVGNRDVNAARAEVLEEETRETLAQALADRSFWQDYVQAGQAERFDKLDEPFQVQLDALFEQADTLADDDYLQRIEQVSGERKEAQAKLMLELTLNALQRHNL